ncbi:MAG: hypothetical protein RLZZ584_4614, partial [Pseudomonadota bacterium]
MPTFITVENTYVSEADAQAVFTLKISGEPLTGPIDLDFSSIDGTASDINQFLGSLVGVHTLDPANLDSFLLKVDLPGQSDGLSAGLQGFNLQFGTSAPNVIFSNNIATALVVDVDNLLGRAPVLTPGDMVVDEAAGTVTISVLLDGPSADDITVTYETQDATAVADDGQGGSDYTHTAGILTILSGQTVGTITIPINNDAVAEGRELFSVFFSNPVNATLADPRVHVVIQPSDTAAAASPTVHVHGATVAENQGYVDFVVTLSEPSIDGVSMDYQTIDTAEATQGADFGHLAGTLIFAPGEVSKTIRVLTIDNANADIALKRSFGLEVFGIIGAVGTATATSSQASAAIVDDEQSATITSAAPVVVNASSAGDVMAGTPYNDSLQGGTGNDVLDGRALGDSMAGGAGDDIYIVEDTGGSISEGANEGIDTVISYFVDSDITANPNFENLVLGGSDGTGNIHLNGAGNSENNTITGNRGNNLLSGLEGNDTLIGGAGNDTLLGGLGVDSLVGGLGDDTYQLDGDGDVVVEAAGAESGRDTVVTTASYTLTANVEVLVLDGIGNINGTGNAEANTITGNAGANVINGGAGNDEISGGLGNDSILGGADNDTLDGGAGNDTLDGGTGIDALTGGDGNDTYAVDNVGDVIIESNATAAGGTDL